MSPGVAPDPRIEPMSRTRKRLWLLAKTTAAVVLIAAVGRYFAKLLANDGATESLLAARVEYLVPAGLLYLLAHTLWATFWVQLLWNSGADVTWYAGVRAYFVSQFGKYVPGKAWVFFLRLGLLRHTGVSPTVVAVTATYETLTSMAAGATVGAVLLPWAGLGAEWESGKGVALLGIAGLPLVLGVLNRLAVRVASKHRGPDAKPLPSPPVRLLAQGLLQAMAGWACLGLSLWLTVQALAAEPGSLTVDEYLRDTAAVALAYVVGFMVLFAPGGLGARELLLQQILEQSATPAHAAVIAVALRLVWTAFEVVVAGILFWVSREAKPSADENTNG